MAMNMYDIYMYGERVRADELYEDGRVYNAAIVNRNTIATIGQPTRRGRGTVCTAATLTCSGLAKSNTFSPK
ncbi:hypothetical protein OG21DRAFT_159814 [Imleria badia]|nr:hypothetical protein OG21DRAFT_159814 [Imleria badia]